ncbi:MAG: type I DNA topoisomerase [Bacteroidetes bacterium]|nr:MAG: type I DNA topoisomerase [Bacteroidota bacterium]
MPKNLLIVESPAKAKTIEKYLGKDYKVKSSMGHVRDLPKNDTAVDVENDYKPKYEITPDKKKVVKELKDWVKKVDEVWLATDEDREGEAISWHLCKVLGLDEHTTKRIVFHEITKPAIQKAIQNPRTLDLNLVDAQQARRILDRLVGFELSQLLWKKVKGKLSAGRVQSVAVRLIVEREREIQKFEPKPFFKITALFNVTDDTGKTVELKAELPTNYETEADAEAFLKQCLNARFNIADIQVKPGKRRPPAPFTTSTLQQEASRKLGYSVQRTMRIAQRLYESGHITYMRTDSVNLSETAISAIADEIEQSFGKKYVKIRRYKGKNSNAQEAHEAIRPTYIKVRNIGAPSDEQRLYELIWKRTIASQMADAELERTTVKIGISTIPDAHLNAVGEVLKFDGFLKVYIVSKDDDEEDQDTKGMLPPVKVGQELGLKTMEAVERFTRPPARFTEASLVSKLEELGIGRPSTYAPTISKIMEENRGYVIKDTREGEPRAFRRLILKDQKIEKKTDEELVGSVKNRLFPTDMGMVVTDFLAKHFGNVMDYSFTAEIEKEFDEIAEGKLDWVKMLKSFYPKFHEVVVETLEKSGRASGERILGKDPASGRTILVRMSKFGRPLVQIGAPDELEEGEKPKYANLNPRQSIETITLEEALELFKLPRDLGTYEGKEVSIASGRFGPYIKFGEKFISIPRDEDPITLSKERAIELIEEKKKADAPVGTYKGIPYTKGKGRFGPFLKWNNMYVNVPKRYNFDALTPEEAHELIEKKIQKEANRYIHKWDDLGISVENGRWGPFIRFKKKNIKIPKVDGERVTSEMAAEMTLEQVKAIIEAEIPDAFKTKKKAAKAKKK